jgi:Ni/Fe-hydrogenase 1 B-type cytochrome subunit
MRAPRHVPRAPLPGTPGSELVRSYVWEWPVRITHWVTVLCILSLALTGYYIHNPLVSATGENAYVMGTVRFVHVLLGFILTASVLVRFYWFFAGNRCSSWRSFIPIRKRQWRDMGEMVKYYSFLRWDPVHRVGHNPLAGAAYSVIFACMLVSIWTGFTLFSKTDGSPFLKAVFGWSANWFGLAYIRSLHYFLMFVFLAFMIHHVYSGILVSIEERNGLFESIITGYKYVPLWEVEQDECATPPAGAEAQRQ